MGLFQQAARISQSRSGIVWTVENDRERGMLQEELQFRVAVALLAILMKVIRWPTRQLTGWNATWPLMKRYPVDGVILSLCGVLWVGAIVAYVLFAPHLNPWHINLPTWARWLGIGLGLSAASLTRWADDSLGQNLSVIVHVTDTHTLVIRGPYRWIRHPIYCRRNPVCRQPLPHLGQLAHRPLRGVGSQPPLRHAHPPRGTADAQPVRRRLSPIHAAHGPPATTATPSTMG